MIKVKILNPQIDRNEPTFRPLLIIQQMLREYSIDITNSNDYDYLLVGMHDFIDKKRPLQESIDYGVETLSKITGDYFLVDGSDSTSLMGAYEVFEQSNAIYLLKNQLLPNREDYKTSYAFNKFFFGTGSDLDLSYDIPKDKWNRIKFTGYNLGYLLPHYRDIQTINSNKNRDICAIFQGVHNESYDHKVRNDLLYTNHRNGLWKQLEPLKNKYDIVTGRRPFDEYIKTLSESKICLSPFGMGELGFRDFEAMKYGTIILKPSHKLVDSVPNMMIDDETFIACNYDWSDLEEKIDYVLSNFDELNQKINNNIRTAFIEKYSYENLCMHWYNMFSNLPNISKG